MMWELQAAEEETPNQPLSHTQRDMFMLTYTHTKITTTTIISRRVPEEDLMLTPGLYMHVHTYAHVYAKQHGQ